MKLAEGHAVSQDCHVLELLRSSYYYQVQSETDQHHELVATLQRLAAQWPTYGYRRLTAQLHREGYQIKSKRVRALMTQFGLTHHAKPKKVYTTNKPAQL